MGAPVLSESEINNTLKGELGKAESAARKKHSNAKKSFGKYGKTKRYRR